MSKGMYFVTPTLDQSKKAVARFDVPAEVEQQVDPQSQEFRNAVNGSIVGAIIGVLYGIATLTVIGAAFIPGILGAGLILGYSALGGFMFGAIVGSTGLFAGASRRHKTL